MKNILSSVFADLAEWFQCSIDLSGGFPLFHPVVWVDSSGVRKLEMNDDVSKNKIIGVSSPTPMIIGNQPDIYERDIFGKKIFDNNYSKIFLFQNMNYKFKNLDNQISTISQTDIKYKNRNIDNFHKSHTLIALTGQVLVDSSYRTLYENGKLPNSWLILFRDYIKLTKDYREGIVYQTKNDNIDVIIDYVDIDNTKTTEIIFLDLYLIK
jgi:hypothetical protein